MSGDIVLSGFVLTAEEWASMDTAARVQLLRAGTPLDGPVLPPIPPPPPRAARGSSPPFATDEPPEPPEPPYEAYELSP
jgi:hypothetical protein